MQSHKVTKSQSEIATQYSASENSLLLRVVDAWVRLTIQEHGARLYKERRSAGGVLPRVATTAGLEQLLSAALAGNASGAGVDLSGVENHVGAAARQWGLLESFL